DRYADASGLTDLAAIAMDITAEPEEADNPFNWIVTVHYSTQLWEEWLRRLHSGGRGSNDENNANQATHPPNPPAELAWSKVEANEVKEWDEDTVDEFGNKGFGQTFANSAGDLLDPLPEIPRGVPVLTITRNEQAYTPGFVFYWDRVNQGTFFG